jgi:hypothetical protein
LYRVFCVSEQIEYKQRLGVLVYFFLKTFMWQVLFICEKEVQLFFTFPRSISTFQQKKSDLHKLY